MLCSILLQPKRDTFIKQVSLLECQSDCQVPTQNLVIFISGQKLSLLILHALSNGYACQQNCLKVLMQMMFTSYHVFIVVKIVYFGPVTGCAENCSYICTQGFHSFKESSCTWNNIIHCFRGSSICINVVGWSFVF